MADATLTLPGGNARPALPATLPNAPTILALDLGTTTGWALRAPDGLITSGTVSFRPSRYDGGGMRYLRFTNWLTEWTGCPDRSPPSGSRKSVATPAPTRRTSTAASWPA